ncbi:hypothetical protein JCM5296_004061 [Sporobolomyces johnsonii]
MLAKTALVASLATLATAQLGSLTSGLSSTCSSAAVSLLGSNFAQCADLTGLVSVFTQSGSIVQPVDSWLTSLCTSGTNCTTADIQNATSIIDKGCSSDIAAGSTTVITLRSLVENFTAEKEALCLQSTSNSTLCATSLLNEIQNGTNTELSISSLSNLSVSSLQSLQPASLCTGCNAGLVSSLRSSNLLNSTYVSEIQAVCGSSFGESIPSDVSEKTSSSNSSTGNTGSTSSTSLSGAAGLSALGGWKAAGFAVAGVVGFAVLA